MMYVAFTVTIKAHSLLLLLDHIDKLITLAMYTCDTNEY